MVKCVEIVYKPQLKGKESVCLKGCHIQEEFNMFSVAFTDGTRGSGQKIHLKVDVVSQRC